MFMKKIIISIVTLFTVLLFNSGSLAQNPATVQTAGFEVIQFHTIRCNHSITTIIGRKETVVKFTKCKYVEGKIL